MKIENFSSEVNRIISNSGFNSIANSINKLYEIHFREIIQEILLEPKILNSVANESYRHQNNFDKIVIYKDKTGWSLRIHIWKKTNQNIENYSDIHNHRWDYVSKIIFGSIIENHFRETISGVKMCKYDFYTDKNSISHYKKKESVNIEIFETNTYKLGDIYVIDNRIVHQVSPQTDIAITFFIQSDPKRDSSIIYTKKPLENRNDRNERVYFSITHLKNTLNELLNLINNEQKKEPIWALF